MKHCVIQQNIFVSCEAAASVRSKEKRETVVCPKPRRLGLIHPSLCDPYPLRPFRWHSSHQQEIWETKADNELLEIILTKGGSDPDKSIPQVASSPPFFSGSPPSRVSNPLIQDERFCNEKLSPLPLGPTPSPTSARKGGCVRANFGNNPAVRVEGFDCLDRDRRNCGIPALA